MATAVAVRMASMLKLVFMRGSLLACDVLMLTSS
jgi:hypothetical protein